MAQDHHFFLYWNHWRPPEAERHAGDEGVERNPRYFGYLLRFMVSKSLLHISGSISL
jgi:hypothetical protein